MAAATADLEMKTEAAARMREKRQRTIMEAPSITAHRQVSTGRIKNV